MPRWDERGNACAFWALAIAATFDLVSLLDHFADVHLVDIDAAAVEGAIGRQPQYLRGRLNAHAPPDVSGLFADLPALTIYNHAGAISSEDIAAML